MSDEINLEGLSINIKDIDIAIGILDKRIEALEKRENYHDLTIKFGGFEMINQARHIEIEREIAELREKVEGLYKSVHGIEPPTYEIKHDGIITTRTEKKDAWLCPKCNAELQIVNGVILCDCGYKASGDEKEETEEEAQREADAEEAIEVAQYLALTKSKSPEHNCIKCEDCWFDLCAKRIEGHGCTKGRLKNKPREDDKHLKDYIARFEVLRGRWGMYFHDNHKGESLTLDNVVTLLNRYYTENLKLKEERLPDATGQGGLRD